MLSSFFKKIEKTLNLTEEFDYNKLNKKQDELSSKGYIGTFNFEDTYENLYIFKDTSGNLHNLRELKYRKKSPKEYYFNNNDRFENIKNHLKDRKAFFFAYPNKLIKKLDTKNDIPQMKNIHFNIPILSFLNNKEYLYDKFLKYEVANNPVAFSKINYFVFGSRAEKLMHNNKIMFLNYIENLDEASKNFLKNKFYAQEYLNKVYSEMFSVDNKIGKLSNERMKEIRSKNNYFFEAHTIGRTLYARAFRNKFNYAFVKIAYPVLNEGQKMYIHYSNTGNNEGIFFDAKEVITKDGNYIEFDNSKINEKRKKYFSKIDMYGNIKNFYNENDLTLSNFYDKIKEEIIEKKILKNDNKIEKNTLFSKKTIIDLYFEKKQKNRS